MSPAVMWDFRSVWQLVPVAAIFVSMDAAWKRLYALVKRIPKGRVITYGQLARATRLPGGARAAGRAMAASPRGQAIPWHRVVAAGGRIAVREPFASLQRRLLESEGARLVEGHVSLAECSWAPPRHPKSRRPLRQKSRRRPD
jgi:methylated-DNA-protein-cysteine methyltransferase-like protein